METELTIKITLSEDTYKRVRNVENLVELMQREAEKKLYQLVLEGI